MSKFLLCFAFVGLLAGAYLPNANAASMDYSKLQMKNLDEMQALIKEKMDLAQSQMDEDETKEAGENLREVLKTILSRPNGDNMVSQILPGVRSKLKELGTFEDTLAGLTDEAIYALTSGKEEASKKATNLFVLENILSEFKPESKLNEKIMAIFKKIRDAKIKLPKEVTNDLRIRGMYKPKGTPSELAEKIIGKEPKD